MNKQFLEQLNEHRYGFRVLDVSSLNAPDDKKKAQAQTDSGEDIEGKDDSDKREDSRKKREKQRAVNLTKYLQYVTAAD